MLIFISLILTIIYFILNILDKGPVGDQGEKGLKGERGDKGLVGLKGNSGSRGLMGEKGDFYYGSSQGKIGLQGDRGEQGEQGERGERGDRGDRGDRGKQGEDGDKGDPGLRGIRGFKGDKGDNSILKFGIGNNIDEVKKVKTLNSNNELMYYSINSGDFGRFEKGIRLDSLNGNMTWNNVLLGFKLTSEDDNDDRFSVYYNNIKITNP